MVQTLGGALVCVYLLPHFVYFIRYACQAYFWEAFLHQQHFRSELPGKDLTISPLEDCDETRSSPLLLTIPEAVHGKERSSRSSLPDLCYGAGKALPFVTRAHFR